MLSEGTGIQIRSICSQIRQALKPVLTRGQTPKRGDAAWREMEQKVDVWGTRLRLLARNLDNARAGLDSRASRVGGVPREHRHSEQQSINSSRALLAQLEKQIAETQKLLEELWLRFITPNHGEVLVSALSQIKDLHDKQLKFKKLQELMSVTHDMTEQHEIIEARPRVPGAAADPAAAVHSSLLVVVASLIVLKNLLRGK